jgi:hypothetical protein
MSANDAARQTVADLMKRQSMGGHPELSADQKLPAEHSPEALPLRTIYIDAESGRLVIGIDSAAEAARSQHERMLRSLLGVADFELRYVRVIRDACPDKKQDCRPLRGGVRMNGDATLNLVILQDVNGVATRQTIASGHAVGSGTGQTVGQAAKATTYGRVIVNPSLANRASDAALTDISNHRIDGHPYQIWRGPAAADLIVNDFAISSSTPVHLVVYMQGAMQHDLQSGRILQKDVTVTDARGTLTNQVYASYTAEGGDSGAPVFYATEFGDYVVYVGIHAGRVIESGHTVAFYSPWEGIRHDLGLHPVR